MQSYEYFIGQQNWPKSRAKIRVKHTPCCQAPSKQTNRQKKIHIKVRRKQNFGRRSFCACEKIIYTPFERFMQHGSGARAKIAKSKREI